MARDWSAADIPDCSDRTAVVTGANGGIGVEVVRGLASKGARVLLAVRNPEKGYAAAATIRSTVPRASLEVMTLDLADLASVHHFAEAVGSTFAIDLLINMAAAGHNSPRRTVDGFETAFGTNYLGHFVLTGLLLPNMVASPGSRVVTVSSMVHRQGQIEFDNLDGSRDYTALRVYAQSKLACLLFAYELQRRLSAAGAGLISVACHPGVAATPGTVGSPGEHPSPLVGMTQALVKRVMPSAIHGAEQILFAATSPDVRGGDYIGPGGLFGIWGSPARVQSSRRSHDEALARQLWQVSENLTGLRYTFSSSIPQKAAV